MIWAFSRSGQQIERADVTLHSNAGIAGVVVMGIPKVAQIRTEADGTDLPQMHVESYRVH
jgi:hypothetical protein